MRNGDGDTALIHAARLNHLDCVRCLLEFGADREVRNIFGETAVSESTTDTIVSTVQSYRPAVCTPLASHPATMPSEAEGSDRGGTADVSLPECPPGVDAAEWAAVQTRIKELQLKAKNNP